MMRAMRLYEQFVVESDVDGAMTSVVISGDEAHAVMSAYQLAMRHPERKIQVEARRLCWMNDVWFDAAVETVDMIDMAASSGRVGGDSQTERYWVMVGMQCREVFDEEALAVEKAAALTTQEGAQSVLVQARRTIWSSAQENSLSLLQYADRMQRMEMLLCSAAIHLPKSPLGEMLRSDIRQELTKGSRYKAVFDGVA